MYSKEQWNQISEIKSKIEREGFKKTPFYVDPASGNPPFELYNHIKVLLKNNTLRYVLIKDLKHMDKKDIIDFAGEMDGFFWELAELFWRHIKDMNPKAGEKLAKELRQATLIEARTLLESKGIIERQSVLQSKH